MQEEAEKVETVMKTDYDETEEFKVQNDSKPIWIRAPKEVTDEEYNAFFKQSFKEFVDPMARNHFTVEGTYEFSGLLFIPGMAPFDMMQQQVSYFDCLVCEEGSAVCIAGEGAPVAPCCMHQRTCMHVWGGYQI